MFNKHTRIVPVVLVSLLTLNKCNILHTSSVSVVKFEQVNVCWEIMVSD